MPAWICRTCGVQHADTPEPPEGCAICLDERQYVGRDGQRWTTGPELLATTRNDVREEEPGLLGIGCEPPVAIGQRALLVQTPGGNVLWDCVPVLDDATRERVEALGGIQAICVSHPHFHGAMVDWADAFDATLHLPRADERWIMRPSSRIELYDDSVVPVTGTEVVRTGGHFDGASVLHWPAGAGGRGALLTGDTITVVQDREWVSFMWSFPNLIPLDEAAVLEVADRVERLDFEVVYGGWFGAVVVRDGAAAVRRSADRYVARLRGERP
ncbi:MBL fold metallo-hydrolase [Nocardioides korecus]